MEASSSGEVHEIMCELIQFKKDYPKTRTPRPIREHFVYCQDKLNDFVTSKDISLVRLDFLAKQLKLIKTSSARTTTGDRIGYGLSKSVYKHLPSKPPRTLFNFRLNRVNGLYSGSKYIIIWRSWWNENHIMYDSQVQVTLGKWQCTTITQKYIWKK